MTNQLLEYWEWFAEVEVMFPGVRLTDDPPVCHEDVINLPVLHRPDLHSVIRGPATLSHLTEAREYRMVIQ